MGETRLESPPNISQISQIIVYSLYVEMNLYLQQTPPPYSQSTLRTLNISILLIFDLNHFEFDHKRQRRQLL